ncbi:MarR family transcriptional regulator [Streptomyces sp. NPDC050504]|uniref:MarR family transcriptional regulator n=1 Tax=Streptomyces sp. NPDC050504 TaxID=3365618 RepID=UPI0037A1A789
MNDANRKKLVDQAPADPGATDEMLSSQPIGYWSGLAHEAVTRCLRDEMAKVDVTQPQYWVLNAVNGGAGAGAGAGAPGRAEVGARLASLTDARETARVIDQLLHRGWLRAEGPGSGSGSGPGSGSGGEGALHLTEEGEAARVRLRGLAAEVRAVVHEGVGEEEYVAALRVLRRMIANVAGR